MNTQGHIRQDRNGGFSTTELVVVMVILAILIGLAVPVVSHSRLRSEVDWCVGAGRSIYISVDYLYSGPTWDSDMPPNRNDGRDWVGWPFIGPTDTMKGQFATSTEFLTYYVTNEILSVHFRFFAPPGVTPATGGYTTFHATNNGWCVVGNVDSKYPATAPLLFTKNLVNFSSLGATITAEGDEVSSAMMPRDKYAPFGGRSAFVFITRGGAGFGLTGAELKHRSFTNCFQQIATNGTRLTNPILRP